MLNREGKRVSDHRSDVLKGFPALPPLPARVFLPILGTRISEAERRDREGNSKEMK